MNTTTTTAECGAPWELSQAELDQAHDDGMASYVLEGIEHSCCLEDGHDGTHVCECGASS